jgi:hypothetical protein
MENIQFVNLTPYTIEIWVPGQIVADEFKPSGTVAEIKEVTTSGETLWGIPMRKCHIGPVLNLPEPTNGTIFIVTPRVAKVAKRADVVAPFGSALDPGSLDGVLEAEGFESFN